MDLTERKYFHKYPYSKTSVDETMDSKKGNHNFVNAVKKMSRKTGE